MTAHSDCTVTIVGGGIVGCVLAAALVQADVPVAIVESHLPRLQWPEQELDPRVSALNLASIKILQNCQIWPLLRANYFSPLSQLLVWDSGSGGEIHFDALEINQPQFGVIAENREIRRVLWQFLSNHPLVHIYCPAQPQQLEINEDKTVLQLASGETITSLLMVGADGGESWLRDRMAVDTNIRNYGQDAIIAVIATEESHKATGWQNFLATGPLAVLPLYDTHQGAIVWSTTPHHANELMHLSDSSFSSTLTNSLDVRLGQCKLLSKRYQIPLVMRHAKKYVTPRAALIGDAAHTIHPLAGQGINLGLLDSACLAQTIIESSKNGRDCGQLRSLRRYERWRRGHNQLMLLAMRVFSDGFTKRSSVLTQLRGQGMSFTNKTSWLKHCFMRYAAGMHSDLPDLAKITNG